MSSLEDSKAVTQAGHIAMDGGISLGTVTPAIIATYFLQPWLRASSEETSEKSQRVLE